MKYLQIVSAPSPIESWLHSQLEARGVDRVYSRYILSLFHSNDVGEHDFLDLDIPSKELKRLNNKKKNTRHHTRSVDTHKLVRASVIETLRSVAETKAGIENLVDELCDRLLSNENRFHSNEKALPLLGNGTLVAAQSLNNVSVTCGVVDLAQKYYDAFPALGSNYQPSASLLLACCNTSMSPWNGKHQSLLKSSEKFNNQKTNNSVDVACNRDAGIPGLASRQPNNVDNPPCSGDLEELLVARSATPSSGQAASLVVPPSGRCQDQELNKMECDMRAKRKLFVEVEEPKDSLASLMEKVDGTKDLWEPGWGADGGSTSSSCSSLLPPVPLGVPPPISTGFIPCGTNLTTSIWSEVEWGGGGKWSIGGGGDDSGVCLDEEMMPPVTSQCRIKAVLNHCPETSAFQAVVLGLKPPVATSILPPPPSHPVASDSENLLTSARTHFCPIEKAPHYKTHADAVQYANGTTFSILSQVDEIDYHVGQDGTLSWDSGTYMEFKANGLNTECYNLYDPFKPKFRVFARDKGIQTENSGQRECKDQGMLEVSCGDNMEDFYFPGEESIARDIMRSLEEAEDHDQEQHITLSSEPLDPGLSPLLLDAWAVAWPPFSIWSNTALTARVGDGWPTPSHDYQELSKPGGKGETGEISDEEGPARPPTGVYTNYSIWTPPFPLDSNSNVILCTKCETPLPLGVNMGNLKISSDRKRRHSSSQFVGAISTFPCIKSEVSFFQQSITL